MNNSLARLSIKSIRPLQAAVILVTLLGIVLIYFVGQAILAMGHTYVRLVIYAFSTQEEVLNQGILPAFKETWQAETGRELKIEAIFGPSSTLAEHINLVAPADVALFSNALPYSASRDNVRLLGPSARATLTLFELGAGDALITYEQDARLALERGVPLEIIVPPRTIIAQHVAVIVDDNITRGERPVVQAFMDYLLSEAGQQVFSRYHLRPANLAHEEFPQPAQPFTVEDLGGWFLAYNELVESLWQTEIEPSLDLDPAPVLIYPGN